MLNASTQDLLFTLAASGALLGLWVSAALVLPWTAVELMDVETSLRGLGYFLTSDHAGMPASARKQPARVARSR
jgi:hypothetical protein